MASLFTGTVEEYANLAAFPLVGVADTIYIALDTNVIYRWDSTAYVVLSPNIIASLVFSDANGFDGTISLVGSVATLTITTALTSGSVPFIGASGALTQDNSNLFFDDTNNRLGIATALPTTPLDVFGSGIIGRLNATSTNNSFIGFSSNGTNKWSAGNVQSDHRFRIFSEANSAELITILQTGEFGIGIANPTTKLHIDGGASALIANLDANVSVAKSISFRSDNSARINLEVSGTESGSNAGADLFIRRYSDAGALIDTPFTITRSTGAISLTGALSGTSATFSSSITTTTAFFNAPNGFGLAVRNAANTQYRNLIILNSGNQIEIGRDTDISQIRLGTASANDALTIASNGAATFSSSVTAASTLYLGIDGTYGSTYRTLGLTGITNGTHRIFAGTVDNLYIAAASGRDIVFWTDGSSGTKMALTTAGVLDLPIGQIKFPATQNASSDANTLDDYEEGTWTATLNFGGASVGMTYGQRTGNYTKVGRQVSATVYIELSAKGSSTGNAIVTGFPFTNGSAVRFLTAGAIRTSDISYIGMMDGFLRHNTTNFELFDITEAGASANLDNTNFLNTSTIMISVTYNV